MSSAIPLLKAVERKSVGFAISRNEEHEWRCILAIRRRQHPAWSQFACGFRADEAA